MKVLHPGAQPALADILDDTVSQGAHAVAEVELFPRPDAAHLGGMETLVAVDDRDTTGCRQRVDVEEPRAHGASDR